MSRPIILGQAPARMGDGRPFSGASGRRLCSLTGLTEEELRDTFNLKNLVPTQQAKSIRGKGDVFPQDVARKNAEKFKASLPQDFVLICAGNAVAKIMGVHWKPLYMGDLRYGDTFGVGAMMPHPSGINHYWNDPQGVRAASDFLRWVMTHHGAAKR